MMKKIYFPALFLTFAISLQAAYIGYVYPAGGRAGEMVELLIGGQGLGGAREVILSGGGISGVELEMVRGVPHPYSSQRRYLTRWVRQIERGNRDFLPPPEGPEISQDWRMHPWFNHLNELTPLQYELTTHFLFVPQNSLQMSPSIAQRVIVRFRIDPKAAPGLREFRLVCGNSISNPVPFYVGKNPEFNEPRYAPPPSKKAMGHFVYPCVLNGQVMPGEVDQFEFDAKKGDVVYFDLKARSLLPFVGDGVPGHFQAVLEVQDLSGKQMAFADDRYFHPDPVMEFRVPADGKYKLLVRDSLYRGRNDFVYRIEIDKNPRPYRILEPPAFAVAPISLAENAKKNTLTLPVVVADAIEKAGGTDSYFFFGKAGEKVVVDVWARRLESPLDAMIEVIDPDGKKIHICDDVPRQRIGQVMQHVDPTLIFTVPKTGRYQVIVRDNAGAGGLDYRYYLRIDQPRPDFRVYAYPAAIDAGSYSRGIFGVVVERLDGFDGPVTISVESPQGYRICGEKTVPAKTSNVSFTIDSMATRKANRYNTMRLWATANGITREVTPATEAMQAFAYTHLIPSAPPFYVTKGGSYWLSHYFNWREKDPAPITLYPNSSAKIFIRLGKITLADFEVTGITLRNQPQGVLVEDVKLENNVLSAVLKATGEAKAVCVNQVFLVNVRYSYKHRNRKTGEIQNRKANVSALLPARRLNVAVSR